jgi:prepilin-type N-terminal cleavage/methylation domain-containing protein
MKMFRPFFGGRVAPPGRPAEVPPLDCGRAGRASLPAATVAASGFTMMEIAISLAIIGIALVAIIGVLPMGMTVQKENREETIINQDATVLLEAIRSGARGLDDLTNYVYAITNHWTYYPLVGAPLPGVAGYNYAGSSVIPNTPSPYLPSSPINNGTNIIGLLSTPEYVAPDGTPLANIVNVNYYSNHVVAYVRSLSGPAVEKPPQDNDILRGDSFGYRIVCVNAPVAVAVDMTPGWQALPYNAGAQVYWLQVYWQATVATSSGEQPGFSAKWVRFVPYAQALAANLHELRLTFLWPQLPSGEVGPGHQTFRTMVGGQIVHATNVFGMPVYFYRSQSFTNAP